MIDFLFLCSMTLFQTPEAWLTYHSDSDTIRLTYNATHLSMSFSQAFERALEEMHRQQVGKLLLDVKRNAPPMDDEEQHLLEPLMRNLPANLNWPIFVAAVLSEGQYQYQIGSYMPSVGAPLPSGRVEFNYFTSLREATAWLSDN